MGVLQGSSFGPLFSLIHINDLNKAVGCILIRLFADDTCLVVKVRRPKILQNKSDKDFKNLSDWCCV